MKFSLPNSAACVLLAVACSLTANADLKVQGVPYKKVPGSAKRMQTPQRASATGGITGLDDIRFWAGDGYKRAAIVFQWNVDGETHSRAYGYRFNSEATGFDMLKAVVEEAPELFAQVSYTTNPEGYILGGAGYNPKRGEKITLISNGETYDLATDQLFESGGYDFDSYTCQTPGAMWRSGWMNGYWSYWTGTPMSLSYASMGMSNTDLDDGSWNFWNFASEIDFEGGQSGTTWLPIAAAEDYVPAGSISSLDYHGVHYEVTNPRIHTAWITLPENGQNYSGNITIPDLVSSGALAFSVTGMNDRAFAGTSITGIALPNKVEYLGEYVFENCKDLSEVTLPRYIAYYGEGLFKGCSSLTSVIWPEGFNEVKAWQYAGTGIKSLDVPENITVIGANAFSRCPDLTSLTFDYEIPAIGDQAFYGSPVREISILQTNPPVLGENVFDEETLANAVLTVPAGFVETYRNAPGWNFANIKEIVLGVNDGDKFISDGVRYEVTSVENRQIRVTHYGEQTNGPAIAKDNVTGYTGKIVIPSTVKYMGVDFVVNEIADYALYGSSVTSLTIPSSIGKWGYRVCAQSKLLAELNLGMQLQAIGESAFEDCSSLTTLPIPPTLNTVYKNAFWGCKSLKEIKGSFDSIHTYYEGAFRDCGFEKIELGQTCLHYDVTYLGYPQYGSKVFADNQNLKEIVFPEGFGDKYTTAEGQEFYPDFSGWFQNCTALESVDLSNTKIIKFGASMFSGCTSLSDFKFPPALENMQEFVFSGTAIPHFDIPETVTFIGSNTFGKNKMLTEMVIPEGVTVIKQLFQGCPNLKRVEIKGAVEEIGDYAFSNTIYNPCNIEELIFTAAEQVEGKIALPYGLKKLGTEAFRGHEWDFVVPTSLIELGNSCFRETNLSEIYLRGLAKWDNCAFVDCPDDLIIYYESLNPVNPAQEALHKTYNWDSEHYRIRIPDGEHYADSFRKAKYSYYQQSEYEVAGWDTPGFSGMEAKDMSINSETMVLTIYPVPVYEHTDWNEVFMAGNTRSIYGLGDCSVICKRVDEESARAGVASEDSEEPSFDDYIELKGYDHGYGKAVESDIKSLPVGNYVARVKYDDSFSGGNYGVHYGPEFTFSRQLSSGISEMPVGNLSIDFRNGQLCVTGGADLQLSVYDIAGNILRQIPMENSVEILDVDLPSGVYIARCGSETCKFVIR